MGKAARAKRERRAAQAAGLVDVDRHLPDPGQPVPLWSQDAAGRISAPRAAHFWRELPGRRVACELCYRQCTIAPGEAGACHYRRNNGGTLTLPDHGIVMRCSRQIIGYGGGQRTYPGAWGCLADA